MPVMEQKHKQDSRKRISREQIENGGPEKKKMKEEEPEHTVSHPGYLHSLLQMFGRANGVCNYLALENIYGTLIFRIRAFLPPEL